MPRNLSTVVTAAMLLAILSTAALGAFADRGDIVNLPDPLKQRLIALANRPRTYEPLTVFAEAPTPSQLFGYYLLDTTGFEPNVFTATIPGINDGTFPTAISIPTGFSRCMKCPSRVAGREASSRARSARCNRSSQGQGRRA
jgi:hypothetical protein